MPNVSGFLTLSCEKQCYLHQVIVYYKSHFKPIIHYLVSNLKGMELACALPATVDVSEVVSQVPKYQRLRHVVIPPNSNAFFDWTRTGHVPWVKTV